MDYTKLSNCLGESRFDRLPYPGKIVSTGNQYLLNTTSFNISKHIKPERSAFRLADPHSKHFLTAGLLESDHKVNGFALDLSILTNFKNNAIHPDNKVHGI